ncbi:hypothetical protein [Amycolatopsis pittospori]|uniref:hypothetical protein n=1 Tax=Amycolatopsis pittospori TaxID=2749434 RepID=UPI0015F0EFC7|nr:hypothetical protein [Amycolatopsis pittospori]
MPGGKTSTTAARLIAVLAAFTVLALLQGALCGNGAAAAGAPCAPLFAAEQVVVAQPVASPVDDCEPPAPQMNPAGHLDDVAGICAALLATLFLLIRLRPHRETTAPPSVPPSPSCPRSASTTTPRLVQLCVSRT